MYSGQFRKVFDKRGLQKYTHENGMTVIFRPKEEAQSVTLGIGSRVGLVHNPLTHPHHHMVFKGAGGKTGIQINEMAVEWGDTLDAFTHPYSTFFFIKVIPRHVYRGFQLLCSIINDPTMEKEAIEKEKRVVINEINGWREESKRMLRHLIYNELYTHHPIRDAILENPRVTETATQEQLLELHRQFYINSPQRLIVVAVGRFDPERLLKKIEKCFGGLTRGIEVPFGMSEDEHSRKRVTPIKRLWSGAQTHLMFGFRAPTCSHPDHFPMRILSSILGQGRDSRLRTELREKRGLVFVRGLLHTASEYESSLWHGVLHTFATCDPTKLSDVKKVILEEIGKLVTKPVGKKELRRNQIKLIRQHDFSLEGTKKHAFLLFGAEIDGTLEEFDNFSLRIRNVKAEDVQRVAQAYCAPKKTVCAILNPPKKPRR